MKKTNATLLPVVLTAAALVMSDDACAQMVDYGSLQSLFGEPITTSVTGTPQRVKDVPANMTIITAEQIRESGSRDIPQVIGEYVPGVDVLRTGNSSYDIGIHGMNRPFSNRLLVLVNGRQVFLDDYSRADWNAIPINIDEIRQIEVVKGPNAALFGNNAIAGVINIITYNPLYDKVDVANVTAGTQNTWEEDATVSQKIGSWGGVKLSAGGLNANEFDDTHDTTQQSFIRDPARRYASGDGVFKLGGNALAEVEASYIKSKQTDVDVSDFISNLSTEISSFGVTLSDQTDYGLWKATSYLNHNLITNADAINPSVVDITNDLLVMQLEDEFKIGAAHTFRLAGEYRNNDFDYSLFQTLPQSPKAEMYQASVSGMWNWQMTNDIAWTNAVRVEQWHLQQDGTLWAGAQYNAADYNKYINNMDANSGLVWHASDLDTVRLTYGRGIQFPSFYESAYASSEPYPGIPGVTISFQTNPGIHPTIVSNYELDYDRKINSLYSTLNSAVFYQKNRDMKGMANLTIPGLTTYISNSNLGDTRAIGFDLGISGTKDHFRWGISDSIAHVSADSVVEDNLHVEKSSPQNEVKGNLGYSFGAWEFDGFGYLVTSRDTATLSNAAAYPTIRVGGYSSFSGRIAYNINDQFTLALTGTDLNHEELTTFAGIPNIERQVFLGLTGKF